MPTGMVKALVMERNTTDAPSRSASMQIFLSLFVLFFRFNKGAWPDYVKADEHKGVAGITILEGFVAVAALNITQVVAGLRLDVASSLVAGAVPILYFANSYFLVSRGAGTGFEIEFATFPPERQRKLYLSAIATMATIIALAGLSVVLYRSAFVG